MQLAYDPLSPRFGAELADTVLLDLSDDGVEALQQLAAERGVVVARNQKMTMQEQADFAPPVGAADQLPGSRRRCSDRAAGYSRRRDIETCGGQPVAHRYLE